MESEVYAPPGFLCRRKELAAAAPVAEQAQDLAIMELRRSVITGRPVPALPSWLTEPLWDQFSALLPARPVYDPAHPLGCHRPRISDRIVFEKLLQVLRFGCSYQAIADTTFSATTIRSRRESGSDSACSLG